MGALMRACANDEAWRRDHDAALGCVRVLIDTCLRKILIDRSVPSAVAYAKETISALLTPVMRKRGL